jgi:hypothetical protein
MDYEQISITLPEDLIVVRGVIMDELFAEWDASRGEPSTEDVEWADRELDCVFAPSEQPGERGVDIR